MTQRQHAPLSASRWLAAAAGLGLTSAVAQVLLLRELLVGFRGNELSLGITLAAWLAWVAVGSAVGGRVSRGPSTGSGPPPRKERGPSRATSRGGQANETPGRTWALAVSLLLLGILPAVSIWFARDLRGILGVAWGEFIPLPRLALATALLIAPVAFAAGLAFPLVCAAAARCANVRAGKIYLAESIGFLVGGVLTFATADVAPPFFAAFATATLAAVFAMLALWESVGRWAAAAWLAITAAALLTGIPARIEGESLRNLYPGQRIVASAYSRYGTWVALAHAAQISFYHNGALAFAAPDPMAAETRAHLTMLQHPRPRRVLLIGGGVDGTAAEILKHPAVRLDYVELDPALVMLARRCLHVNTTALLAHPRLRFSQCDGRLFVKRAARSRAAYDVIIVNLPEPATALLNRFYTIEFFSEARRLLRPQSVLCVGLPAAENYIGPEMQALHGSVYHSLRRVFRDIVVTPGDHSYLFASPRRGFLSADARRLASRWQAQAVPARYFGPYYLEAILMPERVRFVQHSFKSAPRAINHDFRPVGYFYDVALAGLAEGMLSPGAAARVRRLPVPVLAAVGLALLLIPFALSPRGPRLHRGAIIGGVAVAGFTGMTLEVCLLFAVQVLNGHVYSQVGALVAIFMVGLAAGAYTQAQAVARRRGPRMARPVGPLAKPCGPPSRPRRGLGTWRRQSRLATRWLGWLIAGAVLAAAAPLLLSALESNALPSDLLPVAVIGLLMACGGAVVGALFPLAVAMLGESPRAAGVIYAADLAGAGVGALATAVVALPLLGLDQTCWAAAVMMAAAAAISAVALIGRRARLYDLAR